jgi:hypothetical protein
VHWEKSADMELSEFAESAGASVHTCVDCGETSPQTETNYTLISSRYGWRLSRSTGPDGKKRMVWRCPRCWAQHKGRPNE